MKKQAPTLPKKTRIFAGERYRFETITSTPAAADKEAKKYRTAGFKVRVVKSAAAFGRWNPNSRTLYIRRK